MSRGEEGVECHTLTGGVERGPELRMGDWVTASCGVVGLNIWKKVVWLEGGWVVRRFSWVFARVLSFRNKVRDEIGGGWRVGGFWCRSLDVLTFELFARR
jgi:hypothetical protein